MKLKGYSWLGFIVIIIFIVTFILMFQGFGDREYGPNLIVGFIGALISALITLILLRDQTHSEEERDKSIKMYENKLKAFAEFNKFLWEKDEIDDERLRLSCMQNLIFYLKNEQINKLLEHAKTIKSESNKGKIEKAKAEILKILKESLDEKDIIDSKLIYNLSAILTPNELVSNDCNVDLKQAQELDSLRAAAAGVSADQVATAATSIEGVKAPIENNITEIDEIIRDNNDEIKKRFGIGENVRYWHFNALDANLQAKRLKQPNPILSLVEWGESWRTERLQEVQPGDIVFLFYKGGPGYVGMYQALETQVIENEDTSDANSSVKIFINGKETESKPFDDELRKNDIYEAIDDGADYVANILVKELSTTEEWGNPCETVIRQTIARMNPDRTETLLNYFYKFLK